MRRVCASTPEIKATATTNAAIFFMESRFSIAVQSNCRKVHRSLNFFPVKLYRLQRMTFPVRNRPKEFLLRFLFAWCLLYIATLNFEYSLLPDVTEWFGNTFYHFASWTARVVFGITLSGGPDFYSDSLLVYIHVFNITLVAVLISATWTIRARSVFTETTLWPFLLVVLRYFIALMLFMYGFSKIYKWQFFSPEPNTLYQTVGNTPRDLLYWTSMGTSYTYSVFMGVIEVAPAVLLLFRRTTLIGAIIAFLVLLNVVFVNLGFDITVKIHSITLALMSFMLVLPARKRLLAFFTGQPTAAWSYPALKWQPRQRWILPAMKFAVVLLILVEANYRYFETMNFNNDVADKPPLYGAYIVTYCELDPHNPARDHAIYIEDDQAPTIQKLFFHSRGYIIFQMSNDTWIDHPITLDTVNSTITISDTAEMNIPQEITWAKLSDSTYTFEGFCNGTYRRWYANKADLEKLPLLQEEFTWIDE